MKVLEAWLWLQSRLNREEGVVGMEYAVVAAVVIVAVTVALNAGEPAISDIVDSSLEAVKAAISD